MQTQRPGGPYYRKSQDAFRIQFPALPDPADIKATNVPYSLGKPSYTPYLSLRPFPTPARTQCFLEQRQIHFQWVSMVVGGQVGTWKD
jgi:hypothetical protein